MRGSVLAELWLDSSIVLDSASPYEAEPTITTLGVTRQIYLDELEMNLMYLYRWPTVEGGGDIVPFAAVDPKHLDEFVILVLAPRSSSDVRVESFSPSLQWIGQSCPYATG
jgi:hypothetical protein